jgi:hypothetical protein
MRYDIKIDISHYWFNKDTFHKAIINNKEVLDFKEFITYDICNITYIQIKNNRDRTEYITEFYLKNGYLHNLNDAAIICYINNMINCKEWYINDIEYNYKEWLNNIKVKRVLKIKNIL